MSKVLVLALLIERVLPFRPRVYQARRRTAVSALTSWPLIGQEKRIETRRLRGRNRREERFDELLAEVSYSDEETLKVEDSRLARLLRGARAVQEDDKVRRAFEILYCDVAPIRLAGEVVFRKLRKAVREATADKARPEFSQAAEILGIGARELIAAQAVFEALDADKSGTLDRDELLSLEIFKSVGQCENCSCRGLQTCQSLDALMLELDADQDGEMTLLDFMLKAGRVLYGNEEDDAFEKLADVVRPKSAHTQKFDAMVEEFHIWDQWRQAYSGKQLVPSSRLDLVLDGCFAGARNPRVLDALRLVFEDYDSLRVCADLIFKLMRGTATKAPWYDFTSPSYECSPLPN